MNRDLSELFPRTVYEFVPDDHDASCIVDLANKSVLRAFESANAGRGTQAYSPSMMLSLLLYGYAEEILSSRKLKFAGREHFYSARVQRLGYTSRS